MVTFSSSVYDFMLSPEISNSGEFSAASSNLPFGTRLKSTYF